MKEVRYRCEPSHAGDYANAEPWARWGCPVAGSCPIRSGGMPRRIWGIHLTRARGLRPRWPPESVHVPGRPGRFSIYEEEGLTIMVRRQIRFAFLVSLAVLSLGAVAWGKDPGGYVCFAYRTETEGGLKEEIKVWIIPTKDGGYRVVTRTDQMTGSERVSVGFFGGSLSWLGLYSKDQDARVDLGWIDAVAALGLTTHSSYLLPDGGAFETGESVQVAGLAGIEGVFTHTGLKGVTATIVVAEDPEVRDLLPFPLRVTIRYPIPKLEQAGSGIQQAFFSGTIELVFFTRDKAVGGEP